MKNNDWQPWAIKFFAIITATPRWVAALMAAEGLHIPPEWGAWWVPVTAILSAGMAAVEGWAFAYVFAAWRNQRDKKSDRLLWFALLSALLFVIVLAPYIAASVREASVSEILRSPVSLYVWSASVALSTIAIVASVGFAQKETPAKRSETPAKLSDAQATLKRKCPHCSREFGSQNALNAHIGRSHKKE
jgi:hypothetical protein